LAAPWIEGLAHLREQLIDRLRELFAGWNEPARVALLFGSVARGDATVLSDVDLLVIRSSGCDPDSDPWRAQLLALQQAATAWTGNDARVLEYGEDELQGSSAERVIEEALRDGIELTGSRRSLRRLVAAKGGR
jgi:UTP:GlnB (protein PII) uridylyltransferase